MDKNPLIVCSSRGIFIFLYLSSKYLYMIAGFFEPEFQASSHVVFGFIWIFVMDSFLQKYFQFLQRPHLITEILKSFSLHNCH